MGRRRTSNFDLPERVYEDHGTFWYRPSIGKPVKLTRTREHITEAMRRAGIEPTMMHTRHLGVLLSQCRQNAKARAIEFALTRHDIETLWARSGGRCELSLLKFDLIDGIGFRRRPFAPSVDRIDSGKGYEFANCRLVVSVLNLAMNEWGEATFARVARAYVRSAGGRKYSAGE